MVSAYYIQYRYGQMDTAVFATRVSSAVLGISVKTPMLPLDAR